MTRDILVGTKNGLHRLGATDGVAFRGREVTSLEKAGNVWWAIVDGREVWSAESDDWNLIATSDGLTLNCLCAVGGELFLGTSESHILKLQDGALERVTTFDKTRGRDKWHTPWGGPPDVRSISAEPSGTVYANVHVGGIPKTVGGGGSWMPTVEIESDVHQVLYDPDTGLVLAAAAWGLGVSEDGGSTWTFETEGLHGRYLRSVAVAGGTILVGASTGPYTDHAAVYRRPVTGGEFERCTEGLPDQFTSNIDTFCLAAGGSEAAIGTSDGEVYVSDDAGSRWARAASGLPSVLGVALV